MITIQFNIIKFDDHACKEDPIYLLVTSLFYWLIIDNICISNIFGAYIVCRPMLFHLLV
jgi:hypothetical protein